MIPSIIAARNAIRRPLSKGGIPYPDEGESAEWGHAIVAVSYDDVKKIKNLKSNKVITDALLIRNSWGKEWNDKGYGWMPYDYVLNNLAMNFRKLCCRRMKKIVMRF